MTVDITHIQHRLALAAENFELLLNKILLENSNLSLEIKELKEINDQLQQEYALASIKIDECLKTIEELKENYGSSNNKSK